MIKRLTLALCAVTAASANATSYLWAKGQSGDFSGATSYSQYVENVDTAVSDQKEINTEVHASFGSIATYGRLSSNTEVDASFIFGQVSPYCSAADEVQDWITVGGVGMITLHFTMPVSGFMDPNSQYASVNSRFDGYDQSTGAEAYLQYQAHVQSGNYSLDTNILSSDMTVAAGSRVMLSSYLVTTSQLYWMNPTFLRSQADYSHTAHQYIDVVTPGGSITSDSGHNYASNATPEPASFAALGLGALLLIRRRRTA